MRSPTVSRLYLQVDPAEKIEDWSDDRIWDNLATRFALDGWELQHRPDHREVDPADALVRQRPDAPRPAVPRRRRRAHRAADRRQGPQPRRRRRDAAGHGAGPAAARRSRPTWSTATPTARCARVWRCTHFSWCMTSMLHRSGDDFDAELQLSQLRRVMLVGDRGPRAGRELHRPADWRSEPPSPTLWAMAQDARRHTVLASTDTAGFASLRHAAIPRTERYAIGRDSGTRCRARRWPTGTGRPSRPIPSRR